MVILPVLIFLIIIIFILIDSFKVNNSEYAHQLYKKYELKNSIKNSHSIFTDSDKVDFAYQMLGILDSKASALLRIDGIVLAFMALLIRSTEINGVAEAKKFSSSIEVCFDNFLIYLIFGLLMFSMLFSLYVVRVSWDFLGHVDLKNSDSTDCLQVECEKLGMEIFYRQIAYRMSWTMSLFSFLLIGYVISFSRLQIGNFL